MGMKQWPWAFSLWITEFTLGCMVAIWATVATVDPESQSARWVNNERRQYVLMILAWAMLGVDVLAEVVRQMVSCVDFYFGVVIIDCSQDTKACSLVGFCVGAATSQDDDAGERAR